VVKEPKQLIPLANNLQHQQQQESLHQMIQPHKLIKKKNQTQLISQVKLVSLQHYVQIYFQMHP
jgi:hypothetical protein